MSMFFTDDDDKYEPFKGRPKWGPIGCLAVFLLVAGPVGCGVYSMYTSVVTAPGRVVSRTLQTDNIIQNYEWFFNTNAEFTTRLAQVRDAEATYRDEKDADERERLRVELNTVRYSCRDLANSYNANSEKQNRAIFKSRGLPPILNAEECNAPTTSTH